jgi:hypothetical protein
MGRTKALVVKVKTQKTVMGYHGLDCSVARASELQRCLERRSSKARKQKRSKIS